MATQRTLAYDAPALREENAELRAELDALRTARSAPDPRVAHLQAELDQQHAEADRLRHELTTSNDRAQHEIATLHARWDRLHNKQRRRAELRGKLLVGAVASAALALSWAASASVAASGAVDHRLAWLVPVALEGSMLAALEVLYVARITSRRRPRLAILTAATFGTLSVALNVAHATGGLLNQIIAGAIPVALFATCELVVWLRAHNE